MNWLLENKEWIFSGIGIAIFGGMFVLIQKAFVERKSLINSPEKKTTIQAHHNTETQTYNSQRKIVRSTLTPKAILKAVNSVPPLQRKDIAKHYSGIRVSWSGSVASIDGLGLGPDVIIALNSGKLAYRDICFVVNPSEHKGLSLVDIGQRITVEGDIESVGHSVKLVNVKLAI